MKNKTLNLDLGEININNENNNFLTINNDIKYNLPWIEKYRPNTFEEIISHNDILNALIKMIENKNLPHLIFYGPPGTGKTTTIIACAKRMYGSTYKNMILELNGSDDRGINVVREQIKEFSKSKQFINSFANDNKNDVKLVILDEADSMTYDAQFALRRVIENYTSNTRFCLICNYETKIINALKSRCMIFRFSPIPINVHLEKLKYICNTEQVKIKDDSLDTIIELAEGDMRKSINLIQSIHTTYKQIPDKIIEINDIFKQIGYPLVEDKNKIINIIFDKNINLKESIKMINKFKLEFGLSTSNILKEIVSSLTLNISNSYNNVKPLLNIFDKLGDIEIYMASSYNDNILLANIISIVKNEL
jgi:replication factor C subunit 3/5